MQVLYVPRFEVDTVLQPDAALWQASKPETVKLKGTPLDMQPSGAIKASWANKKIGAVHAVQVAEEQARVARLAYAEGVITSVEAQDAELGLTAARFALLRARLDAATARAELKFAVGE